MVQVAIIAARNQAKSFKVLLAGNVPADGEGWFRNESNAQTLWRWLQMIGLDGSNVPALAQS
jgi:hypothetical protein